MFDRLVTTFFIIGGLGMLWLGWRYYKARLIHSIRPDFVAPGKPTLLYFSGEYCKPCKFQQTPIIKQMAAKFGNSIEVKEYDVSTRPEVARQYNVLTLPTTVILNPRGEVTHINYGDARQSRLEAQLL